jgi:uncharacterized protein YutE (UPF0331/DUF86 family)
MVDKPKLDQMLGNLKRYHGVLQELAAIPEDAFRSDKHKIGSAKYHFIVAIECCIDIANHIISSENYRFPGDNAESFVVLIEQGILSADKKTSFQGMARFRNRLVHLYWNVEDELVYQYLQTHLQDFPFFAESVSRFVSS